MMAMELKRLTCASASVLGVGVATLTAEVGVAATAAGPRRRGIDQGSYDYQPLHDNDTWLTPVV